MNRLSQNTLILLINNIITAVLSFGLTVIITRGLGDAGFGRYAAVMAWILPFTMIADGGLNTLLTRDVAQQPTHAHAMLRNLFPLRLAISSVILVSIWFAAPFLSNDRLVVLAIQVGIWLAIIDAFFGSYTAIFRAWEIMWPILLLNSLFFSLQIIGAILIFQYDATVVDLVTIIVVADAIQLTLTWLLWRFRLRYHVTPAESVSINWLAAARRSYPFAIAGLLAMLNMRAMILILDQSLSAEDVGYYALAFRLLEATRLLPNAIFVALFPRLSALSDDPKQFKMLVWRALLLLSAYAILAGISVIILAPLIIPAVFGLTFQPTVAVLSVLIWVLLPANGRALFTLQLYAYGQQQFVNVILIIGLILQIVVGYSLVQWYGLLGAPIAVIIGELVLMIGLGWRVRRITSAPNRMI